MSRDTIARRVVARGTVQGVFFRASTRQEADRHNVAGWVRNDPGGSVTAHLEGPAPAVERVIAWIRAGGPPKATVEAVEVDEAPVEARQGFEVRH